MTTDPVTYEIDRDGRMAGLGIGLFGVLGVVAAFGGLRGAPGAVVLLVVCVAAIAALAWVLKRGRLVLDERGISDERAGQTTPWTEVASLGLTEDGGQLIVQRTDGLTTEIPLAKLEASPEVVLERAERVRTSASPSASPSPSSFSSSS